MLKLLYKNIKFKKKLKLAYNDVKHIVNDIKKYGYFALKYYIKKIDGIIINKIEDIFVNKIQLKKIYNKTNIIKRKIIKEIYIRIKKYHNHYYNNSWQLKKNNIIYGQKLTEIEKICVYVPGGQTIYPSSVFMNTIPSLIYKPKHIYMLTPMKNGLISKLILSISYICKINKIIMSGGVHTLSCMVYGIKSIPKINKLVGPGNYYITESKKIFFGSIGIDMLAGPTELIILCKNNIHPKILAIDFYSQLEHDINAKSYLITNDIKYINLFYKKIYYYLKKQINKKTIFKSLNNSSLILLEKVYSLELINFLAPEHLMICEKSSCKFIKFIKNAGAIFLNYKTSESPGDYFVGPSHVIPTSKNCKFDSALNINCFVKRISIIKILNNKYSNMFTTYISNKEKFFCHSNSSNIRI